jgi:hypothetical protein
MPDGIREALSGPERKSTLLGGRESRGQVGSPRKKL